MIISVILFTGSLLFGMLGIVNSSVERGVSNAIKEINLNRGIDKAQQQLIDQKQDAKIDNLDTRLVNIENSRK